MEREGSEDVPHLEDDALDSKKGNIVMDEEEDGCELVHENSSTGLRVYRMSGSDPTGAVSEGPAGIVAVKVLAQERPDPDRLTRLYDEYIISRSPVFSRCSAVRSALQTAKHNGWHAICLEWAEGITLREWVRSNMVISSQRALRNTVHLGCLIAGAIAEMHDAGVAHNNVATDNIIMDDHCISKCTVEANGGKENGVEFSVKIIGLGSAVLLEGKDSIFAMHAKRNDLRSLGAIIYEMLRPSMHQNIGHTSQRKALSDDKAIASLPLPSQELERKLCSNGIPQCLAMLVSKLMLSGEEWDAGCTYQSASKVQHDLDHICDFPERFLFEDVNSGAATGRTLEFPSDRLYGRVAEVSVISDAFNRVVQRGGRSEIILVSGASGTRRCIGTPTHGF